MVSETDGAEMWSCMLFVGFGVAVAGKEQNRLDGIFSYSNHKIVRKEQVTQRGL